MFTFFKIHLKLYIVTTKIGEKTMRNPVFFVALYVLFMLPTYILPYLGSNSLLMNATAAAMGMPNPAFFIHFLALVVLVVISWVRNRKIAKSWFVIFPILALIFDLIPGLNSIPLVPTIMHISAIVLNVMSSSNMQKSAQAS